MSINELIFTLLSACVLVFSALTIFSRRILRAAMNLLIVLIATAGFYYMLEYDFLAGVQLSLYAGGIVVLIIFSVLLTSTIDSKFENPSLVSLLSGLGVSVVGAVLTIATILQQNFTPVSVNIPTDMTRIGLDLTSLGKHGFALPFEVISILLLSAMIGSIVIAKKTIK